MNTGCFFKLSEKTSMSYEGIVNYDYMVICAYSGLQTDIPKYPISLSITKDAVVFSLHCYGNNRSLRIENLKDDTYHVHDTIISIPYMKGGNNDAITEIIKSLYREHFPVPDKDNARNLCKMLNDNEISLSSDEKSDEKENMPTFVSYSSLSIFGINRTPTQKNSRFKEDKKSNTADNTNDSTDRYTKVMRMLFLDFLFDLKHTDVFKTSPWYDRMIFYLNQNYYFCALRNKAEYYYQCELINGEEFGNLKCYPHKHFYCGTCYEEHSKEQELLRTKLKSIGDNLVKAEKRWIASILDPQSDKEFYEMDNWVFGDTEVDENDRSWFLTPESEIKKIYFESSWLKKVLEETCQITKEKLCYWCPKKVKPVNDIKNSINFFSAVLRSEKRLNSIYSRSEEIRKQTYDIVTWSLNRYCYNTIFGNLISIIIFGFLMTFMVVMCAVSCLTIECPSFFSSEIYDILTSPLRHDDVLTFARKLICGVGIIGIIVALYVIYRVISKYPKTFLCVLLVLTIATYLLFNRKVAISVLGLALFTVIFRCLQHKVFYKLYLGYKNLAPPYFFNIQVFQPKLIAPIIAAMITGGLINNLTDMESGIKNGTITLIIGAIVAIPTISLLYDDIRQKVPYLNTSTILLRSIGFFLLGFLYSILIGIISISTIVCIKGGEENCISTWWKYICDFHGSGGPDLWNFLIFVSFVALFFGVFVNMLASRNR